MFQNDIHRHRPQTWPNVTSMLSSIKELSIKLLRYVKVIRQENIMVQKHEILSTAMLDILIEKVIASNPMRITSVTFGQELLLWQLNISDSISHANSKYLFRTLFLCRIVKYCISKRKLEELFQRSYLIFNDFRIIKGYYCQITEVTNLPPRIGGSNSNKGFLL